MTCFLLFCGVIFVLQLEPKQKIAVLVVVALILFGGVYKYVQMQRVQLTPAKVLEQANDENGGGLVSTTAPAGKPKEVVVHVAGAVIRPGVYHLPEGSRVVDAVEAAGPAGDARLDLINLAAPLVDGQKVPVPGEQDTGLQAVAQTGGTNLSTGASGGFGMSTTVNINTADQVQLETLPGIGPSLAGRIIQYRETNGPYRSPEDIKNVSGIGDKRYEQLKSLISVY